MANVVGYLGIDVGGTKVALRVEADGLQPRETTFRWAETATVTEDLEALAEHVGVLLDSWGGEIGAVGVAMPATLDGGRVSVWPNRPTWAGLELTAALRELFPGTRVSCADDGDIAAMAEARHAGVQDLVYLGVGTGIGGGVVLDGRCVPGPDKGSCEVGHVVVDRSGPRCDCGRQGCVQALASGPATLRRAAELRGRDVPFDELRQAWLEKRPWAVAAVRETCAALAAVAVGLTELTHPAMVLVGGGFADALPGFVGEVRRNVAELARPGGPTVPVEAAALGGRSSLYGALLLARDALTNPQRTLAGALR